MSDKIHILYPDQSVRSEEIKTGEMIIGRDPECAIVLNHPSISRQHAILNYDGERYTITDLQSLNGTFIENVELAPQTPQPWQPGENLRLGEVWLRLEHARQVKATQAMATVATSSKESSKEDTLTHSAILQKPDGSTIQRDRLKLSTPNQLFGVLLESPNISVSPGSGILVSLSIFNLGTQIDRFRIQVEGLPPDWIVQSNPVIEIPPDRSETAHFTIKPPRIPSSKAGLYRTKLLISSLTSLNETVELRPNVTVTAYSQFISELRPENLGADGHGQILVQNQGNLPETFTLSWEDMRREVRFDPPSTKVIIPPAQTAQVDFRVDVPQPHLYGKDRLYTFVAHVRSPAGKLESHPGNYSGHALIPPWAPGILAGLCVAIVCMLTLFVNATTAPRRTATAIAAAELTQQAQKTQQVLNAIAGTESAITLTAQAFIGAQTATTTWQMEDSDGDGLSNAQEQLLYTKPDDPDTDKDGLNDGDEVNKWKTLPLVPDTDGDGLIDGEEVNNRKTDPLNNDTDNDGIEDGLDPDPLNAPTPSATPSPSRTLTPTVTPSITPTPTYTATSPPTTDLVVSITNGQASSVPGTNIVYTIAVKNNTATIVQNVRVEDNFPNLLTSLSWSCSGKTGSSCQQNNGNGNIDTLVNLGEYGEINLIVNATILPDAGGLLINSVRISPPPGITDTNTINNLAIDSDTLTPRVSFDFSKTDQLNIIAPGEQIDYIISLENNGPSSVRGVTVFDIFPSQIQDVTWICTSSVGASCVTGGNQRGDINTKVNLEPGSAITISASGAVALSATGVITNTANISSPIDPHVNNISATDRTEINAQSDLAISVAAPVDVNTSETFTIAIDITNDGPSIANNVTIESQLPPGGISPSTNPGFPTCSITNNSLTCDLGSLTVGASREVEITLTAPSQTGVLIFHTEVSGSETDPNLLNNAETVEVEVN